MQAIGGGLSVCTAAMALFLLPCGPETFPPEIQLVFASRVDNDPCAVPAELTAGLGSANVFR